MHLNACKDNCIKRKQAKINLFCRYHLGSYILKIFSFLYLYALAFVISLSKFKFYVSMILSFSKDFSLIQIVCIHLVSICANLQYSIYTIYNSYLCGLLKNINFYICFISISFNIRNSFRYLKLFDVHQPKIRKESFQVYTKYNFQNINL